jgi:copper chaperone CopZ
MPDFTLHIEGMSCNHCLNAVRRALQEVEGTSIGSVQIGRAEVASEAGADQLVQALERAGYHATAVAGTADQ